MNTPIYDFLRKYKKNNFSRLHMPGHKGIYPYKALKQISKYDITEIKDADFLFEADGVIGESEDILAKLYNTKFSCYSTSGSTLCIQTMLKLLLKENDKIIAARNVHKAFINTCGLLKINPVWIEPEYKDNLHISGEITAEKVERAILSDSDAKAVYITTPDYLGIISDVKKIADICHKYNKYLIVDNAHGAYLKFMNIDIHPITLGADMCCDSAHKTLPAFTGAAYLHANKNINVTKKQVKDTMSIFSTTSPSYLILESMDLCNKYLIEKGNTEYKKASEKVKQIKQSLKNKNILLQADGGVQEELKITVLPKKIGYTGFEFSEYLRKNKIECEYESEECVVLMFTPFNTKNDYQRLKKAIAMIPEKNTEIKIENNNELNLLPKKYCEISEAMSLEYETVKTDNSLNMVTARTKILCPPGVPIVVPGEIIDDNIQKLLKKSSILTIDVLK